VDARSDLETYCEIARSLGLKILYVIDTHVHADHVSGGRALAHALGADYCLHESAPAAFEFRRIKDGEALDLGNVAIRVMHTPGHTQDSVCLAVVDRTRGDDAWFVLTGDALLVGDAGRPDLSPERDVDAIYDSLHRRLAPLADDVELFPAHFSGSVCGRALSGKPSSTLGFERRHNAAFQPRSLDEFRRFIMDSLPQKPPAFERIIAMNLGQQEA
jgi:glyoxylase-like metal-dependent hydrolase (beta-lactamase superfamily II)